MLSPLRDEFLLRFLFWEDVCFVLIRFRSCFCQGCSMRSDYHLNIYHRVVQKCTLLMSRRGLQPLRDHQCVPCSREKNATKPHHFYKPQFYQCTHIPVTQKKNLFWFQMVSSGSFKKKRKEKKITLFVRKTKYSYAILNLLCLGCRYAVPK